MAKTIGGLRRIESIKQGLKDAHGYDGSSVWDTDIEGAAAELAYCKFRGQYWGGHVNNYKEADVGRLVQVRFTKYQNGNLIVRKNDSDDHYYVLVTGCIPRFTVVGWIKGDDAKNEQWLSTKGNNREAAYFVPQSALNSF